MATHWPVLFLSHGAPSLAIEDSPARRFLTGYGRELGQPQAILVISAHWQCAVPTVSLAPHPETIHDFGGFDPALNDLRYPAPGAPALAARAADLIAATGLRVAGDPGRGLDHGAWVPLSLLYPEATVPVTQLSLIAGAGAKPHWSVGRALAPLRAEGTLIVASGAATHNLRAFFGAGPTAAVPDWVTGFTDWLAQKIAAGDPADLLDYRRLAPFAVENHPTEEHLLPLFVALGAAGTAGSDHFSGRPVHRSLDRGVLAMDAYAFD